VVQEAEVLAVVAVQAALERAHLYLLLPEQLTLLLLAAVDLVAQQPAPMG
jgi:hypothetical protein